MSDSVGTYTNFVSIFLFSSIRHLDSVLNIVCLVFYPVPLGIFTVPIITLQGFFSDSVGIYTNYVSIFLFRSIWHLDGVLNIVCLVFYPLPLEIYSMLIIALPGFLSDSMGTYTNFVSTFLFGSIWHLVSVLNIVCLVFYSLLLWIFSAPIIALPGFLSDSMWENIRILSPYFYLVLSGTWMVY